MIDKIKEYKYKIILAILTLIVAVLIIVIVVKPLKHMEETVVNQDVTISESETNNEVEETQVNKENTDEAEVGTYNKIMSDVLLLKKCDAETIKKYYGNGEFINKASEIFSNLKVEKVNEDDTNIKLKIYNLDYELMNIDRKDYENQVLMANSGISYDNLKSYVDANINENKQNGKYNCYFIVDINTEDESSYITENLKRALSGKYYNSLFCDIESKNDFE